MPTALAVAESEGVSGRDVVTAIVAGYEAIARLGMAAPGAFHARGWHATSACGTLAAALTAGTLLRLDARRLASALGIAGSFASGLMEFLEDGSAVKRLHAGWAGHAGIVAATLAAGGVSGPASVLEGRFGFYRTFVGTAPLAEVFETLGREWETPRIGFKPYPCCHLNHAYIDCALRLREEHRVDPEAIVDIECHVPTGEVPIVCEPRTAKLRPRTTYEAQFSLPFATAAALLDGRVGLGTFTEARLGDERLLGLAARVRHVVDAESTFPNGFPREITAPLRKVLRGAPNVRYRAGDVAAVDFERKRVRLSDDVELPYDYLVLATGSTTNYYGNESVRAHALGLKDLGEALQLRNHVLECLDRAANATDDNERRRLLNFCIVGGGPTGVEYSGALAELARLIVPYEYPELPASALRILLLEGGERLLPMFVPRLSQYARRELERRGVEVRTNTLVASADDRGVMLRDGSEIETATMVWTAGVRPNDLLHDKPERLPVDDHLRLVGAQHVFAIGDVAAARDKHGNLVKINYDNS